MEHHRGPRHRALHRLQIRQVAPLYLQARALAREGEVLAAAGGEIVEDADPMALGEQALDEMRADEARSTGDEGERWGGHEVRDGTHYGCPPRGLSIMGGPEKVLTGRGLAWHYHRAMSRFFGLLLM
jgi:hypothetical protein